MSHLIDTILEPALWFAVDWSLRWAALLTVVALLLWIFRPRRAVIRESVLKAALLAGLLIPLSPRWGDGWQWHQLSTPSLLPSFPRSEWERTPGRSASRPVQEQGATQSVAPVRSYAERGNEVNLPRREHQSSQTSEILGSRRLLVLSLTSCWSLMVTYQLMRCLGGWFYLRRLRHESVKATGPTADLFVACRAELRTRNPVRLAVHPQVRSPILVGCLRPCVLVPPDWPQRSIESQRAGLLHELAHIRRGDHLLVPLLEIVRIAFFFHPLVRWLFARLEREREWLCDEMVVRLGIDRREYARQLLEFARSSGRLAWSGLSLPMSRRRTVRGRIYHLLEDDMERWIGPLPARWAVALGLGLLAVSLGMASYRVWAEEKEKAAAPEKKIEQQPAPKKPAEPAIKREDLRYADKDFYQWRRELLTELKPSIRADGMKAFAAFGVNGYGQEATQAILEMMLSYDPAIENTTEEEAPVVNAAFKAIQKIGAAGVPTLVPAVKEENRNVRRFAIDALRRLRGDAHPALPKLIQAFKSEDLRTRQLAIQATGFIGQSSKELVAALTEELKAQDASIRYAAVVALGSLDESAQAAIPALLKVLSNENSQMQIYAMQTLRVIGARAKAVPAVSRLLRDEDQNVRHHARRYLQHLKPDEGKEAVPTLIEALKSDSGTELWEAEEILGGMGPAAKDAIPALTQLLQSDDGRTRERALNALKAIRLENKR
jgi:HEAT repeat protein/beta-lactamase regulating signal transducer with metallopeptidase domain